MADPAVTPVVSPAPLPDPAPVPDPLVVAPPLPVSGLEAAEKAIYDEFEKVTREALAKAKAAALAIGADINSIIGPTEDVVVKDAKVVGATLLRWWEYLLHLLDFLDDPKGKFSYKRGSGVAALVTSIIFAFKGDFVLSLVYFAGTVAIAIVCGLTKT